MQKSGFMSGIEIIARGQWPILRELRLSALQESPEAFLSTHDEERSFSEDRWQAEFDRGTWHYRSIAARPISLLGVTREANTPIYECYLEYMWVSPELRRSGIALDMLTSVLRNLRQSGVQTAFLWVLNGNDAAVRLYHRAGFISTNHRQPIANRPGRTEERMALNLH